MAKAGSNLDLDGQGNPVWLLLELTYKCPLKCAFCSNPTNLDEHQDELTTAEWKTVIHDARKMGAMQIGFSGGEPTLRKDLEELVAEANGLGYYTNLITSGIGLTHKRLENLKEAGLRHIQLGFQSSDPQTAHWLAGVDCYEKKINMAREIKALGFPMVLNVPISSINIHQVPDIIRLAADIGVEYLELANVQYYNWALVNRDQLMPTREALQAAEAQVAEAREQLGDRMTIFFVIPDYYEGRPKACMNGWGSIHLTIAPDGVVLPCSQARSLPGLTRRMHQEHGTFRYASLVVLGSGALMLWNRDILADALMLQGHHAVIGVGAWIGTIMVLNLWFVLWPHQKKVLGFVPAPAAERIRCSRITFLSSRTNTILSFPLVFFMAAGSHGLALF